MIEIKGTTVQIHATNLALSAGRGPVYGPLTFHTDGGLTVLRGDPGSGRTSLLLTLAGRMKPDAGSLTTGGHELPRSLRTVQKISGVAGFDGIDSLEESVTVGAALRERRAWLAPWWTVVRRFNDVDVARTCAPVFGSEPIPHAGTVIWDLDATAHFLLRITLAMMNSPEVLFVDDIEQLRSVESRAAVWGRLAEIAAGGTDVVVSASSLDEQLWWQLDITPQVIDLNLPAGEPGPADLADQADPANQADPVDPAGVPDTADTPGTGNHAGPDAGAAAPHRTGGVAAVEHPETATTSAAQPEMTKESV